MSRAKSVEELKQDLQAAEEQYKRLLDKNQDDLISIKQREVQVKVNASGFRRPWRGLTQRGANGHNGRLSYTLRTSSSRGNSTR